MTPGTLTFFLLVLALAGWLICGYLSMELHRRKGYDGGFLIGFLLGPVGLLYSVGLPDNRARQVIRTEAGETWLVPISPETDAGEADFATRTAENECSNCFAKLSDQDTVCPNCGRPLRKNPDDPENS